jgi:hypothetical protein
VALDAPPPGETVIYIPEEGKDSGRRRILLRIGLDEMSWIGSFEAGSMSGSTVQLMPDCHLFVSAEGAGYIIDWRSLTLVATIGTEVEEVIGFPMKLFIVNHSVSLERFGTKGRLWKTGRISSGGFRVRQACVTARQPCVAVRRARVAVRRARVAVRRARVAVRRACVAVRRARVAVRRACVAVRRACVAVRRACVAVRRACVAVRRAGVAEESW